MKEWRVKSERGNGNEAAGTSQSSKGFTFLRVFDAGRKCCVKPLVGKIFPNSKTVRYAAPHPTRTEQIWCPWTNPAAH